jgi:hypothetical protein
VMQYMKQVMLVLAVHPGLLIILQCLILAFRGSSAVADGMMAPVLVPSVSTMRVVFQSAASGSALS